MPLRTRITITLVAIGAMVAVGWLVLLYRTPPNNTVTLVLNATVGSPPLIFNEYIYTNPGGSEKFKIRDFRFYISNIKLSGKEGEYVEDASYHLARFDNEKTAYVIVLKDVGLSELNKVALSIGVDPDANTSLESIGDLDPNSQMAWNWEVGYKFVLLEGGILINDQMRPLVYHIGFSENRRDLVFDAPDRTVLSDGKKIRFNVDVMKFFASGSKIDMTKIPSVKLDKNDARLFAENYQKMIKATW
jgi:hypothetical protein